ncbi:MAG: hypothetical protein ACK5DR_11940, partial [Planctomyces sp.]
RSRAGKPELLAFAFIRAADHTIPVWCIRVEPALETRHCREPGHRMGLDRDQQNPIAGRSGSC